MEHTPKAGHQEEITQQQDMSSPPAKKQKHETATNILLKPFKTPLKLTNAPTSAHEDSQDHTTATPNGPETLAITLQKQTSETTAQATAHLTTPFHTPHSATYTHVHASSSQSLPATPQRINRRLETQISTLRTDIDDLTQALRLLHSVRDVELESLAAKWRGAARSACEELFAGVKDKVNRMGGVGAWRERERERVERREAWAEEDRRVPVGPAGGKESTEDEEEDGEVGLEEKVRREERRQARREMREAQAFDVSEYDRSVGELKKRQERVEVGRDDDVSFF